MQALADPRPWAFLALSLVLCGCRSGSEPGADRGATEPGTTAPETAELAADEHASTTMLEPQPNLDAPDDGAAEDPTPGTVDAGEGVAPRAAGDVGPVPPEEWRVIAPDGDDTFALVRAGGKPVEVVDTIVQASPRTALIFYQNGGPYRGVTLRNSILRVEPGTIPLDRSYWAFRGYDMIDTLVADSEITGFGVVTDRHDEGHAIYLNVAGAFTVLNSHLHHNGGQAVQLVNRPGESVLPPGPAAGEIRIENTRIAENGFNPDRGGFQVAIYGTGQPIVLRDVEILAGQDDTEYPRGRTGGGLVVEAESPDGARAVWWKPPQPPEDWVVPFTQGPTLLERVTVRHRDPNKPIVQIKGCEELVVRDSWFEGGKVVLDHPAKPGRDSGRIVWQGNGGDAELWVRGRRVGQVDQDYEF